MKWYKSKTIWTGVSGVVSAMGLLFTGDIDQAQAIQLILTSLIGIFLKTGQIKNNE